MAGEHGVTPERYEVLKEQFGYNLPIWQQYLHYVGEVLTGDFGVSISSKRPVLEDFSTLFPATIELSLCAIIFAILFGIPAGIFAAVKRGSWFDQSLMGTALIGYSMPIFWWGLLLIIFFSGYLGWTPVSGRIGLQFFFKPITGFMMIDTLIYGKRDAFTLGAQPSDPADDRARHHSACGHCAADALGHARSAGRGLCAHGARQGPFAAPGDRRARACATR